MGSMNNLSAVPGFAELRIRQQQPDTIVLAAFAQLAATDPVTAWQTLATLRRVFAAVNPVARVTLKGEPMPLTIDSTNGVATLSFEDRIGEGDSPPAGTTGVATSDNTAVLTVGPPSAGVDGSGNTTLIFPLTPVAAGTANLSVHATLGDGSPLVGPDGTTPIPDPDPIAVTVNPGAPAQEVFTESP